MPGTQVGSDGEHELQETLGTTERAERFYDDQVIDLDADHYTRIRTYQSLLPTYPHNTAALSLLNLAGRSSGSRGA